MSKQLAHSRSNYDKNRREHSTWNVRDESFASPKTCQSHVGKTRNEGLRSPLGSRGKASLDQLARAMKSLDLYPDLVIVSGSCRTRETACGIVERLGIEVETIIDDTIYSGGAADYMQSIRKYDHVPTVMLVGHNPSIEDLALALCGDGKRQSSETSRRFSDSRTGEHHLPRFAKRA